MVDPETSGVPTIEVILSFWYQFKIPSTIVVVAYGCTGVVSLSQTATGAVIGDIGKGYTLVSTSP